MNRKTISIAAIIGVFLLGASSLSSPQTEIKGASTTAAPTIAPTSIPTLAPTETPIPTNTPIPTKIYVAPTSTPVPTKPAVQSVNNTSTSTGGDKDCGDFSTHAQAQAFFIANGGPGSDPHRLDGDNDGDACETLP